MSNRILREGILSSDRVEKLTVPEEIFYRRLMSVVDDFGRYAAHPKLLRAACYPLRLDVVSDEDVGAWVDACERAGLLIVYNVGGKAFLEMQDFRQRLRRASSKYPPPDDSPRSRRAPTRVGPMDPPTEQPAPTSGSQSAPTDACLTDDGHVTDSRPTEGGQLTDNCPTADEQMTDSRPTEGGHVTDEFPAFLTNATPIKHLQKCLTDDGQVTDNGGQMAVICPQNAARGGGGGGEDQEQERKEKIKSFKGSVTRARDARARVSAHATPPQKRGRLSLTYTPPPWVDPQAWEAFVVMRVAINRPMTDGAAALIVAKLERLRNQGHDPTAVLNQSVMNAWRGVFRLHADESQHAATAVIDGSI